MNKKYTVVCKKYTFFQHLCLPQKFKLECGFYVLYWKRQVSSVTLQLEFVMAL